MKKMIGTTNVVIFTAYNGLAMHRKAWHNF